MKKRWVCSLLLGLAFSCAACNPATQPTPTSTRRPTFTPLVVNTPKLPTVPVSITASPAIATNTPNAAPATPMSFTGSDPSQKPLRFVFVQQARCSSTVFWCPVEQGIQDAAHQINVTVSILGPGTFNLQKVSAQIDQAIDAKPDGIALTVSDAQALREPILRAIASGIPIVAYNAGAGPIKDDLPYLMYLGSDDYQGGYLGAYRLIKAGAKAGVCLSSIRDLTAFQRRCKGFQDAFTEGSLKSEMLNIPSEAAQAQEIIKQYGDSHPEVNAYFTAGHSTALLFYNYLHEVGHTVSGLMHGTFDLSPEIRAAIEDQTTLFAIDQQPYLQGYSAVFWLTMINRYGFKPASPVFSTGPYFVDKNSIAPRLSATSNPERTIKLTLVHHGLCSWDSYWCIVDQGAKDAAHNMGVNLSVLGPESFDLQQEAALINTANSAQPDGLAVTIPDPVLLHEPIFRAIQAGYPVLAFDTGAGPINDNLPYLTFIGQDEYQGGYLAALRLIKAGAKAGVCINQQVGQVALDKRCQGMIDAFREKGMVAEVLDSSGDAAQALRTLQDYMRNHPNVNALLTLGGTDPGAVSYYRYLSTSEHKPSGLLHGTFDLSSAVVSNIENGTTLFAVDAQPYLQGYTAVMFLTLYLRQGIRPVSGITATGPAFVDQSNVMLVKQLAGKYR